MKLRLLLFEECNRHCNGCCNKDWDLVKLPICTSYKGFDEIILTGGEPLLHPDIIISAINQIRFQTSTPIYLYTAKVDDLCTVINIITLIDGITITLHTQKDVNPFIRFLKLVNQLNFSMPKSFRVNIFKGIVMPFEYLFPFKVKDNIKWITNCPLPKDEVFQRYNCYNND